MSRMEERLRRDLTAIAERATPSSDAWATIQQRIADQDPIQETEIIMLTENTLPTRRWPLAAAAAIVVLAIGAIALVVRDDDVEAPAEPTSSTAPVTTPTTSPAPETTVASEDAAPAGVLPVPFGGRALEPARYSIDTLGVPIEFEIPDSAGSWEVGLNNPLAFSVQTDQGFWGMQRIGSFLDADQAQEPNVPGLGNIPPDDFDGWIEANGIIVDASRETSIDGRTATFRQVRVPPGAGAGLCPEDAQPCIRVNSVSADAIDANPNDGSRISGDDANAYWMVELGEFEPVGVWAYAFDGDIDAWLDEITPIIESITLGEPGPAVEGGTARLPERITVDATMTVNQQGERTLDAPWPVERSGRLSGDVTGTYTGAGTASPNGAEVTLDWTADVTVDGFGSGTLMLRSHWSWSGDGAATSTDHVLGGTGDLAGVTGFGTGVQTSDRGPGNEYTADIQLMLARPTSN